MSKAFGLKPIKSIIAAPFNSTIVDYVIDSSVVGDIFLQDPIVAINNTDITGIEFCQKALPTSIIAGVIVGFQSDRDYENDNYRKSGTRRIVRVIQDPFILFEVMVNAVLSNTDVGKYIKIDSGIGNISTGYSEIQLDYATIDAISGQFKIMRILKVVNTDDEKYTIVQCLTAQSISSVASDLWDRNNITGTLTTHVPGDNVHLGGWLEIDGSATVHGKLTVDGLIDPTGLTVTPQATPPSTANGTHYYDSVSNKFLFRQNGAWVNFSSGDLFSKSGTIISPTTLGDSINVKSGCIGNTDLVTGYSARFITPVNETAVIVNNYYINIIDTAGDGWQSFTAVDNNYFSAFAALVENNPDTQLISVYSGDGIGGSLITSWSQFIDGSGIMTLPYPIKLTSGNKYTVRFQGTAFLIDTDGGAYAGGKYKGTFESLNFKVYTKTGLDAFNINSATGYASMPSLALSNGIIQINSAGLLSSSTVLPNGTTVTKQTFGDNTNLAASTSFVQDAIEAENFWDRVGTTLYARHSGDNINILSGCFSNIDNPADANLLFSSSAEIVSVQQTTFNASESTGGDGWQSFTATDSNFVTKISIRSYGTSNPQTISILSGEGTGGTVLYTFAPTTLAFEWTDLVVTIPFPISIGQKYTIRIVGVSFSVMTWFGPPGPYVGGSWKGSNNSDLAFKVWTTGISANAILQRSTGRLGLGILTPTEMLDVVGKIKSSDTIYAPALTATTQVNTSKLTNAGNIIIDAVKSTAGNSTVSLINSATSRFADFEIDGNLRVGALYTSGYRASVQSADTDTWLEILNNTGAGNGIFFGVTGNNFELYNYQLITGHFNFYLRDALTWQMLNTGAFTTPSLTLGTTQNVTQILTETTWAAPTNTQLATKLSTKTYIDNKAWGASNLFIAVKNANQNSVTGDSTAVQVTYGDEKVDISNDFDGTYFVAPANCSVAFKVGCVLDIAAGTNTWFSISLRRVNSADVLQETVPLDYGLIADNLDVLGNANLLGKSTDIRMNSGDKVSFYVIVAGNATKNISVTSYNYQRFSGFVTARL